MSQRDVERTLGRLLTDAGFRREFFVDPARACLLLGVQLAPHEVEALLRVPRRRLAGFAGKLDDRICRLDIGRPGAAAEYHAGACLSEGGAAPARPGDRVGRLVGDPSAGAARGASVPHMGQEESHG